MAKKKKKTLSAKPRAVGGPYLAAAVFCESIVPGADQALSAIRIIDRITVTLPPDAPTDIEQGFPLALWVLLIFKSGDSRGPHRIQLVVNAPSGERREIPEREAAFSEGPSGGASQRVHLSIGIKSEGLYLVDVLLDRKLMTRMPLQVVIKREEIGENPEGEPFIIAVPRKGEKPNGKKVAKSKK